MVALDPGLRGCNPIPVFGYDVYFFEENNYGEWDRVVIGEI